jgi:hypothetical protein
MSIVHISGTLEFASAARCKEGLAAFEAGRYIEFTDPADFEPRGPKTLAIDVEREVEIDCTDNYHKAFVALAKAAKLGHLELRWGRDIGHTGAVWAGGHYLELEPAPPPGPLQQLAPERLMRRWTEWPGRMAEKVRDDVRFSAARVSPDGSMLVAAGGPPAPWFNRTGNATHMGAQYKVRAHWGIAAFDVATGGEKWRSFAADGLVSALGFAPDGARVLAGCSDGNLYVLDAATGATLHTEKKAFAGGFVAVAWSPDGELIAAAGRPKKVGFRQTEHTDQSVRLWRLPDWTPQEGRDDLWNVQALVFSPDNDQLTIWLKNPRERHAVLALRGEPGAPHPIPDDGWDFTSERMARKQAKKGPR